MKSLDNDMIASVVQEVLARINNAGSSASIPHATGASLTPVKSGSSRSGNRRGVFQDASAAAAAARQAQLELRRKGIAGRDKIVKIVKRLCSDKAVEWGKLEFEETRIGRLEHKIEKLQGIPGIPGVEWLSPYGVSGDHGIMLEENAPFGVVAGITPVTHSIPTIAANIISMVAAGNATVFNAHPGGARCAAQAVEVFNEAIHRETGLNNVVTIIEQPSLDSFSALCRSDAVDLLCITGGPMVVKAAMRSGKRAICAGPGNPPVVIDQTADLDLAARSIILGGGYDNNLLCIGEKQVFVVAAIYDAFIQAFKRAGAAYLPHNNVKKLAAEAFTFKEDGGGCSHPVLNREFVGADASVLARAAGVSVPEKTEVLFGACPFECPFVQEEQMMPMIPVIKARDVDEAIEMAYKSEHGFKHSAIMHSRDVGNLTRMGRKMDCTLFVKNGASVAGLGIGGEGYASFSIATTTGEGIVTPTTFTRKRRCVMVDNLNIV